MTPPAHDGWEPADYYRASRAARAAWQAQHHQLSLGVLEDAPPTGDLRRILEPAHSAPASPGGEGGLAPDATEPSYAPLLKGSPSDPGSPARGRTRQAGASVASISHVGPDRTDQEAVRGRGQGGHPTMLARILHPGVRSW